MSSTPLNELWAAAASQPYSPTISKDTQFAVGFILLLAGMHQRAFHDDVSGLTINAAFVLTGIFSLSK